MIIGPLRKLGPLPAKGSLPPSPLPRDLGGDPDLPQEPGWKPYALAAVVFAGAVGGLGQGQVLDLPAHTPVVLQDGRLLYSPPSQAFGEDQDWSARELVVRVKLPAQGLVVGLRAVDAQGKAQSTRWTEGQSDPNNPGYDPESGILTLRFQPTRADVDEHGATDEGFDPRRIRAVQLVLSNNRQQGSRVGLLEVQSQTIESRPVPAAAQVRPLLGHNQDRGQPREGVSQYFRYADLQHWDQARPEAEKVFREQQAAGKHAFRLMGGLDLRAGKLPPEVFPATREYLKLAQQYGQDEQILTLLDGAVPNAALQQALQNPEPLVDELRPFIREFGNAQVNGKPIIFDLVNEIHGSPGPEAAKQRLVERLVDTFVEEAPGARLTVGVQNYRELKYWTYLFEKYAGQPVEFVMTFHVYEPMTNVPDRKDLNLPAGAQVGITEADPNAGYEQTRQAREKGYDWMLFWRDGDHPYDPTKQL